MADIRNLIEKKTAEKEAMQEARQVERDNLSQLRSAALETYTSSPEMYQDYLRLQGANIQCSVGNVALTLAQMPEATQVGTREYWHEQGRFVKEEEMQKGATVFLPPRDPRRRGYFMGNYYDVSQTTGKPLKAPSKLEENGPKMEEALESLMGTSPVGFQSNPDMDCPAYYDSENMVITINPDRSNTEVFVGLAEEIAHARAHNRGRNTNYNREEFDLDAQSVAYLLCQRFGIDCPLPDASHVAEVYEGYEASDRESVLDEIRKKARDMGNTIERAVFPRQQEQKHSRVSQPTR